MKQTQNDTGSSQYTGLCHLTISKTCLQHVYFLFQISIKRMINLKKNENCTGVSKHTVLCHLTVTTICIRYFVFVLKFEILI